MLYIMQCKAYYQMKEKLANRMSKRNQKPEYNLVEKPLLINLGAIGHRVGNKEECENGIIDIVDWTDHEIIECKPQGNIYNLGAAYGQLKRYQSCCHFEIGGWKPTYYPSLAIAVPYVEDDAEPLARLLQKNGVRIIRTKRTVAVLKSHCRACDQMLELLGSDIYKFKGDEQAKITYSGIDWCEYVRSKALSVYLSEEEIKMMTEHKCFLNAGTVTNRYQQELDENRLQLKEIKARWHFSDDDIQAIMEEEGTCEEVSDCVGELNIYYDWGIGSKKKNLYDYEVMKIRELFMYQQQTELLGFTPVRGVVNPAFIKGRGKWRD